MSKIDERITRMTFDNKSFEQGISESSKSLANFDSQLEKSGNNAAFGNLNGVVEGVSNKFSVLGTIAVGALLEIGEQAVRTGTQLVKSLAIEPITQGYGEYELKINSIKTMLASGKTSEGLPVTLDMVNEQLAQLNEYSDKTIYSFADMTANIGKFTNAGVNLEASVQAIKGIANAAALSGANSNEASRAMYNFAQALSAGYVKLIDWKSIENANMATVEFKTQLLESAVAAGTLTKTVDGMYQIVGSNKEPISATVGFNDSLQEAWMTTEALTATLAAYADETTEIGAKATEAATKVRTFSQLMDTTKEAIGSGWSQSFELIIGDYDLATELYTGLSDAIGGLISTSSDARNQIISDWVELGGRASIIDGVKSAWEGLQSILKPIREAFENVFPPITGLQLADLSAKFKEFAETIKIGPKNAEKLKTAFEGLFSVIALGWDGLKFVFETLKSVISAILPEGDGLLSFAAKVGQCFIDLKTAADNGEFFSTASKNVTNAIQLISDKFSEVVSVLKDGGGIPGAIEVIIGAFESFPSTFEGFESFTTKVSDFFKPLKQILEPIGSFLLKLFDDIKKSLSDVWRTEGFAGFADILNILLTGGILAGIQKLVKSFTKITDSAGGFLKSIKGVLNGVKESLEAYQNSLKAKTLLTIAGAVAILAGSLIALAMIDPEKLTSASIAMGVLFAELATTFVILEKSMTGTAIAKVGFQLIEFAAAVLILSNALQNIAEIPSEKLSQSIIALTVILGELVVVSKLMSGTSGFGTTAFALIEMAIAIKLIVSAIQPLGEMDTENLKQGLLAVGAIAIGMASFAAVVSKIGNGATLLVAGAAMGLIAIAILEMSASVAILGSLDPSTLIQGLVGLGVILAEVAAFSILISKTVNPATMLVASVAMVAMGVALVEIAGAVAILGVLDTGSMIQGIIGLAGAMGIMVAAMLLTANPMVLAGAAAMVVMAASVLMFTPAIIALGAVPLENIGKALLALFGIFAIIGVGGLVLAPLTPVILGLAAAIALLGVAVLAIGAGLALFGTGLAALAAGGTAGIALLTIAISEAAHLIPLVLTKIGEGIVALAGVIATGAPAIAEAIMAIVSSLILLLTGEIPKLITVVLTFIGDLLVQLVEKVPEFIDAGMKIIIGFLEGVAVKLPGLIEAGANIIIAFLEGIGQQVPRVIDAGFKLIIDFINGLADAIRENTPLLLDAVTNLCTAFLDGILIFFGISNGTSEEGKGLAGSILQGIIDGIGNSINLVVDAIVGVGTAMIDGFKTLFGIASPSKVMEGFGDNIVTGLINGINSLVTSLINTVKGFVSGMISAITDKIDTFRQKAVEIITNFIEGIKDKVYDIHNTVRDFVNQMVDEIQNKVYEFVNVGKNIANGIIDGISSMTSNVVSTVKNLASSALDGIKDFLGIASPSKAFIEIGKFCSVGMAEGITKYANAVVNETKNLGGDALSTMKSTMTKLADAVESDIDAQPIITPVLDLSDVKSGANTLANMLNKGQTYGLAQTISKQNATKVDVQNGSGSSNNSTTINNKFELNGLTVRSEADIDAIAKKLYQKQQTSMRGKGLRTTYA
ncbi:MAG: tape measure protein [Brevinema sp.]